MQYGVNHEPVFPGFDAKTLKYGDPGQSVGIDSERRTGGQLIVSRPRLQPPFIDFLI